MINNILKNNKAIYLDGAMGTYLYQMGLEEDLMPEYANFKYPELVKKIHKSYLDSGSEIIITNTFNSNKFRLKETNLDQEKTIKKAIKIAKSVSGNKAVALDIGPLGVMMEPYGQISFEEAYNEFKKIVEIGVSEGCDLIVIESMYQIEEMKAAILAAKENSSLLVFASMTFSQNQKTIMGISPSVAATIMDSLGADAIGANCSFGPDKMSEIAKEMLKVTKKPIIIKANAGTPIRKDNQNIYMDEFEFSHHMLQLRKLGVKILGGCCGTNKEHIKELVQKTKKIKDIKPEKERILASNMKNLISKELIICGLGVNSSYKNIKDALIKKDYNQILRSAIEDQRNGADILDINIYLEGQDECKNLEEVVNLIQNTIDIPLIIDSQDLNALERALRIYTGKAIINGGNCSNDSIENIFKLGKKYGSSMIFMLYDEDGIARSLDQKIKLAKKLKQKAKEMDIEQDNIIVDFMAMPVNTSDTIENLRQIKLFKEKSKLKVSVGVLNSSYGFPRRNIIERNILSLAIYEGVDILMVNTKDKETMENIDALKIFTDSSKVLDYIEKYKALKEEKIISKETMKTEDLIRYGFIEDAKSKFIEIEGNGLKEFEYTIKSTLDDMNNRYERQEIFIPELIKITNNINEFASAIKGSLKFEINKTQNILLACVSGDFHDLSKNISKIIHEVKGYNIKDLGVDVSSSKIIQAIDQENFDQIILFGLMTKSVETMKATIKEIRNNGYLGTIKVKIPEGLKEILKNQDIEYLA